MLLRSQQSSHARYARYPIHITATRSSRLPFYVHSYTLLLVLQFCFFFTHFLVPAAQCSCHPPSLATLTGTLAQSMYMCTYRLHVLTYIHGLPLPKFAEDTHYPHFCQLIFFNFLHPSHSLTMPVSSHHTTAPAPQSPDSPYPWCRICTSLVPSLLLVLLPLLLQLLGTKCQLHHHPASRSNRSHLSLKPKFAGLNPATVEADPNLLTIFHALHTLSHRMQFSDLYRSPKSPLARLRHQNPQPLYSQENDWDPDLFSREKGKQKAAIKRYLEKKVQTGWEFQWSRAASSRNSKQSRNAIARDEPDGTQTTAPSRNGNVTLEKLENLAQESRATPQPDQEALKSAAKQAGEGSVSPASHAIKGTTPKTAIAIADCENSAAGPQVTLDETGVSTMTDARPEGQSCGPGYEADPGSQSDYSTLSEDPAHFHSRRQWESGEETEHDEISYASSPLRVSSPYDFDNPDSVGVDIESQILVKQAKKRRELRKEMEWNEGLACFEARRDAWTGAKTVRLKPTVSSRSSVPEKPLSPLNPRRLFGWDKSTSPSPNKGNMTPHLTLQASQSSVDSGDGEGIFSVRETRSKDTNSSSNSDEGETLTPKPPLKKAGKKRYPVTTIIHKPPPLLPPENPMRASITPATYNSILKRLSCKECHLLVPSTLEIWFVPV